VRAAARSCCVTLLLYEKTMSDGGVELAGHLRSPKTSAQALQWYLTSQQVPPPGDWKTKAREAVVRMGR